jgi:hypothetical protein
LPIIAGYLICDVEIHFLSSRYSGGKANCRIHDAFGIFVTIMITYRIPASNLRVA